MTFPWMESKFVDKAVVCGICRQWISQGEPRMYHAQSKISAHHACAGAKQMNDHYAGPGPAPPGPETPKQESREAAIERMHGENYDAAKAIGEAVRSLKATVVETNMLLSELVRHFTKQEVR